MGITGNIRSLYIMLSLIPKIPKIYYKKSLPNGIGVAATADVLLGWLVTHRILRFFLLYINFEFEEKKSF